MYLRAIHAESHIPTLRKLIHDYPLGVLTTAIPSQTQPFIQSSHIPWILDVQDESNETELGKLRGHMARQNPQSQTIIENLTASGSKVLEQEVLVLFTTTPHHYVTPKFYTETKPATGKVVPTWNYAAVQAYGKASFYFDSKSEVSSAFLQQQIEELSQHSETSVMDYTGRGDRPGPWKVGDAPDRYIEIMKKNIIGVEIEITRLQGKFKMSQEMGEGDRIGVVKGFERLESDVGKEISRLVDERGRMKKTDK